MTRVIDMDDGERLGSVDIGDDISVSETDVGAERGFAEAFDGVDQALMVDAGEPPVDEGETEAAERHVPPDRDEIERRVSYVLRSNGWVAADG